MWVIGCGLFVGKKYLSDPQLTTNNPQQTTNNAQTKKAADARTEPREGTWQRSGINGWLACLFTNRPRLYPPTGDIAKLGVFSP
jgi:hypothetical protein